MKRFVSLLIELGLVLLYFVTETEQAQESADIVFLIDGSNKVERAEFQLIHSFIANIVEDLNIGASAIQTAVVQYSNVPSTEFYLKAYNTKRRILKAMQHLHQNGGHDANVGLALQFLMDNHFVAEAGSRAAEKVPQVMILITSRQSTDDIKSAVFLLKKLGTFIFVVGVKDADADEMKKIATDPSFTILLPDIRQMASARTQLMPLLSLVAKKQLVIEVQESKVEAQVSKRDIIFLIDGSSSVGHESFLEMVKFISNIVNKFVIGSDSVQVAVVQSSDDHNLTEWYLNTHTTQSALQSALTRLRMNGDREVYTGAALDYVFKKHFTRAAGSRKEDGIPQLLVVITGERSVDDVKVPVDALKRAAVMTIAIGVKNADQAQIKDIAIDPSLLFYVDRFQDLHGIRERVMAPLSTLAGVTITYDQPTEPSIKEVDKKDIVFLVDGSYSRKRRKLPIIQSFITKTIEAFDIGSDAVQVGLVQYSDRAKPEFFLNTYSSKDEMLSHVRKLRQRGGTVLKTGEALKYVLKYIFNKYSGSRHEEGVPQFLVLITGGKLNDDVKQISDALSRAGIKTLAIGFENATMQQLQEVTLDANLVFDMKDLRSVPEVQQKVLLSLSTLNKPTQTSGLPISPTIKVPTEADKKDIVFLIDGSFNVGDTNLPAIREFIKSIIQTLDIGTDRVQVGLVQYSDIAEPEFFLNTYSREGELIARINKLTLRGGTELKTGAALNYVQKYVFTRDAGSRKEESVPQFLILITGGRSKDDIKAPSDALLRSGVMTIAIGTENAVKQQLQEAALNPSLVYHVKEFHSLPEIQQAVLLPLSTLNGVRIISELPTLKSINENAETQERDIVFLIDDSWRAAASFDSIREFLYNIIKQLNIGEDRNRVAVVQYSEKARVEFPLDAYTDKGDLLAAVQRLRPAGGSAVNTGAAMKHVVEKIFATAAGRRRADGTPQILVLLTCSKSTDDVKEAADALKRAPIVTFVIGVPDSDRQELQEIAYSPNLLFEVQDFKSLPEIQEQLLQPLTTLIIKIITMPRGVTEGHKRDIVFLIDGSSHVGIYFYLIRDFIVNLIPHFDIGKDKDQISVVQYSGDTRVEFPLNALTNTEDALAAVKMLRQKGGNELRTGAALDFVRKNVFSKSGGGRKHLGSSQILLLVTSRKSQDDVWQPSEQLKQAGVVALVVGIGDVEGSELRQIAYSPSLSFRVDNYMGLSDLDLHMLTVSQSTENVPIPLTIGSGVDRRDIVFLIDGSAKLGKGFKVVRKFMAKIVEGFDVGVGKVQFGVVQFSENPRTEFFLNSHATKKKVMVAIKKLKLKRGKKINIGQALDHVMHEVFTSSAGSRIGNAIPQILVLLTCGKSNDDISQQADKLRKLGIVLFGIGLKEADEMVLEPLAYSPALAFPVKSTKGLVNIQHQLQQIMKTVAVEVVE
ncbi:collagen alpha-3(VI) chain-like isoform X1 [Amblyraja radiata]|uniref:collagen alpha-3(VI) chain-like isoform X1 n=1 Tax=Amblyraja radiata TaxID=386614 RepID=UPI0014038980|nr:collagen alpha-3(VI) chain-like isoform X1 [Amblyraja radiata]